MKVKLIPFYLCVAAIVTGMLFTSCDEKELEELSVPTEQSVSELSTQRDPIDEQITSEQLQSQDVDSSIEASSDTFDGSKEPSSVDITLSYAPPSDKYRRYDESVDGHLILNTKLVFNGKELTLPFTVQDMLDIGWVYSDSEMGKEKVDPGQRNRSGNYMLIPATTEAISFEAMNLKSETCELSECYVITFSTASKLVTVNGITTANTKYEDLLEKFGKSSVFQTDSFEEEMETGRSISANYNAYGNNSAFGRYKLTLSCNVAKKNSEYGEIAGTVNYITVRWAKQ